MATAAPTATVVQEPEPTESVGQEAEPEVFGETAAPVLPTASVAPTPVPPTPTPPSPLLALDAELIADGFSQPVLVAAAPGASALFVVEREGLVLVVEDGVVADEPFLDLRDQLTSSSIEQGLLGLAFHPEYEANGRLFVYWTRESGDSRLAEFTASGSAPADPSTMRVVFDIEQPAERHNAGMIAFGPDGLLYLALGDGGSGGTTAQDTSTPLGSIVRLDIDSGEPYAIPEGNPFGDEVWVYGLRNPWRFSIDPVENLVYIGDVGQDRFEEINVVSLDGAGTNFGWLPMEGDQCFEFGCDPAGLTLPTVQYNQDDGCSVTGGYVYRGSAIPEFWGHYFYADWCSGAVSSFRLDDGEPHDQADLTDELAELGQVTSFGLDNDAELYVTNWDGQLFKIIALR